MSWQIGFAHTRLTFTARHMMISKVHGEFGQFDGTVEFDQANPAATTIDIQVETASLSTGTADRDNHLKSPDFFDVENYPHMTFKSKRVDVIDDHHARLVGDLTIRDVTNEITFDVEYLGSAKGPRGQTSVGFTATTKIKRADWNLTWNMVLETGGVLVSEKVTINLEIELVEVQELEKA